jgi:hypothetical protein
MLKQKIEWNDDSKKSHRAPATVPTPVHSKASLRAAMNRNMVIPQPHREIASIDSAIRRNESLTNSKARVWNVGSECGGS